VRLLIEPLNRVDMPDVLLAEFELAAELIDEQRSDRLGLQFDVYHAAMNGLDPCRAFADHARLVRHVQFSDAPGRHEPGTGSIDFEAILAAIHGSGYDGWAGAEYVPSGQTETTLGWLTTWEARFGR
jgi:hydroxypyruvate isomerase